MPPAPKLVPQPTALAECEDDLIAQIERLAATYPDYELLITGHSLGGGMAVLFGVRLFHDKVLPESVMQRVRVVAYAPLPTLSLPAAAHFDHYPIWSIVNGCDIVPRLQVNSLDRFFGVLCTEAQVTKIAPASPPGQTAVPKEVVEQEMDVLLPEGKDCGEVYVTEEDVERRAASEGLKTATAAAGTQTPLATPPISPSTTSAATPPLSQQTTATPRRDLTYELHHPGRVLMFTSHWEMGRNRLVEVPRGHLVMHEVFAMKSMVASHFVDNYMEMMQEVHTYAEVYTDPKVEKKGQSATDGN